MFYKIDSRRYTFREYWLQSPNFAVALAASLTKILRISLPCSSDDPNTESLTPFQVSWEELPYEVQTRMHPFWEQLHALGFHSPVFFLIDDAATYTRNCIACFCHESGAACAEIRDRVWSKPHPPQASLYTMFFTAFSDGSFLETTGGKLDTEKPPNVRLARKTGATPAELWQIHCEALSKEAGRTPYSSATPEEAQSLAEAHHAALRDFYLKRGLFVPKSENEIKEDSELHDRLKSAAGAGVENGEVLAEIDRLQNAKANWKSSIWIFLISLILFIVAGSANWSWSVALLLVPILFFHESGHYVAMRIFKYKNLRMFFIPFFGAAVSGRHYNVPGWKKVVVSLMGPVPGIVAGIILGCVGIFLHQTWCIKAAMLTLLINGFNLLPVLPMDGGWVVHTVLFCRHPVLDVASRLLAGLALIGSSIFLGKFMMWVGIFMLMGLQMAWRQAKIVQKLRNEGFASGSPDDENIPPATAQAIITEIKKEFPKGQTNTTIATMVLAIFETMNSRPPGIAASFALLIAHFFSFVAAVVFGCVFIVGQHGDLAGFAKAAAAQPKYAYSCGSGADWRGAAYSPATPHNVVVVTQKSRIDSQTVYASLQKTLPPEAACRDFGQSVLVSIPAADEPLRSKLVGLLQKPNSELYVQTTNMSSTLTVTCIAPTEEAAKKIEQDFSAYALGAWSMHLIPPWIPQDGRSQAEKADHDAARQVYSRLIKSETQAWSDPRMKEFQKKLKDAIRTADKEATKKILEEQTAMLEVIRRENIEKARTQSASDGEKRVIEQYAALPARGSTNYLSPLGEMGRSLGQLPLEKEGGAPTRETDRYSMTWGSVNRNGLLVTLQFIQLMDAYDGAPALLEWLCRQGCQQIHYQLQIGGSLNMDEEEGLD